MVKPCVEESAGNVNLSLFTSRCLRLRLGHYLVREGGGGVTYEDFKS